MRILEDMARQRPELSEIIDADGLEEKIRLGEGKAFFPDPSITRQPEIDFLKLGCSKK